MKKIAVILVLSHTLLVATAYADCEPHLSLGAPVLLENNNLTKLCYSGYSVGFDSDLKVPRWVAYRSTPATIRPYIDREGFSFKKDPNIAEQRQASGRDYYRSGYDRGHLAPAAAMDFSAKAIKESFYYSNVAPQKPGLNRKGWLAIEKKVRKWVYQYGVIFSVVGTVFDAPEIAQRINNKIAIPDSFYYAIYSPKQKKGVAYLLPNKKVSARNIDKYKISINELEAITNIDFFPLLPDALEGKIENYRKIQ